MDFGLWVTSPLSLAFDIRQKKKKNRIEFYTSICISQARFLGLKKYRSRPLKVMTETNLISPASLTESHYKSITDAFSGQGFTLCKPAEQRLPTITFTFSLCLTLCGRSELQTRLTETDITRCFFPKPLNNNPSCIISLTSKSKHCAKVARI